MGYGRWAWGQQSPGGGRGTSKDAGGVRPRGGGSVGVGSSVLPDILLTVAKECMVIVKTRLVLSFISTFPADIMPSLLRVPPPTSLYPLTTWLTWLCLRNASPTPPSLFGSSASPDGSQPCSSSWLRTQCSGETGAEQDRGVALGAGEGGGDGEPGVRLTPGLGSAAQTASLPVTDMSFRRPRLLCGNQSEDTGLGDTLRDLAPGGEWRFSS